MDQILKTILLEYAKSNFLIDLKKDINDKNYIRITQNIQSEAIHPNREILINPNLLKDFIKALQEFEKVMPENQLMEAEKLNEVSELRDIKYIDKFARLELINRYLKGIELKHLTLQYNLTIQQIEEILRNANIEIVEQNFPKSFKPRFWKRKNKK